MKILVTGAAGFIGFHTARALLTRGDQVVGLDNLNEYYDINLKHARLDILRRDPAFEFVRIDLADRLGDRARQRDRLDALGAMNPDPGRDPIGAGRVYLLHGRFAASTGRNAAA